ncbi:MAG: amidohydrolase [Planctomycetes bacterium]|nr:amidohydrolase [Planctomycetota bacterium]
MFAAVLLSLCSVPQDLVLRGATVHTGTGTAWSGPLVVAGGRVAAPGTEPSAAAVVVELPQAFVVPGLQDAHGHLLGLGAQLEQVDLVGCRSYEALVEKVAAAAAKLPKGQWVLGRGWDQNRWPDPAMPHHAELSAAVPDHPVWLWRVDGHAGLANLRALRLAGVVATSEAPPGGEILFGDDGEPTGVLVDAAMSSVPVPEPNNEQIRSRLLAAQEHCLRLGLTCVHDAGVTEPVLEELRLLHKNRQWHLRVHVLLADHERERIRRGPWHSKDGLLVARAVKTYADGALGSRGAALLEEYSDRPGWRGNGNRPVAKGPLRELAQLCVESGMQLCVHAIGDGGNRAVLDVFAELQVDGGLAARRFRIEHAQVVAKPDFARFLALGVLPSMQPTHLTSDMPWALARLGPERVLGAYAFRTFLELGAVVPFGSDFPVESADPRHGLFAAVTTRPQAGGPAAGLRPDQQLTRAQALRGFTAHAAFASFAEADLGTIEAGKRADFTVFDRDLLVCSDDEILQAVVLLTVVDGRVVYDGRRR